MKKILAAFAILSVHSFVKGEDMTGDSVDTVKFTTDGNDLGEYQVCRSEECKERAMLINTTIERSFDPCDDFYSFVCAKWNQTASIQHKWLYGVPQKLQESVLERMKRVIEDKTSDYSDQGVVQNVRVLYNSCIDFRGQENTGDGWTFIFQRAQLPKWPILPDNSSSLKWEDLGEVILQAIILPYFDVSLKNNIQQAQEGTAIKESGNNRTDVIKIAITAMNPNISNEDVSKMIKDIVGLDDSLSANIRYMEYYELENKSILWLEELFPNVTLVSALLERLSKAGINITRNSTLMLPTGYFSNLQTFINNTTPDVLYNYAGAKHLYGLTNSWQTLHALVINNESRWRECLQLVRRELPEPFTYLYAESTFDLEAKEQVKEIARRVNATLVESINNMTNINESTKESILKKVAAVQTWFGYSDNLFNITVLASLYSQVPNFLQNSSFLELLEHVSYNSRNQRLKKFFKQESPNPIYIVKKGLTDCDDCSPKNRLEFPLDIFQPPFYTKGLPWSLNYGGFGASFAHQLVHDMHKQGDCRSPKGGNACGLFGNDNAMCESKSECFLQQYKKEMEPEFNTLYQASVKSYWEEGKNETAEEATKHYQTQFEAVSKRRVDSDIADTSGLSLTLSAYMKLLREECENTDTRLEGLEKFSGLALLFITRGMAMCGKTTDDSVLWVQTTMTGHSPPHYRVNLPLQNTEAFAKAFNCTADKKLYKPKNETCTFW